jgi:hypothetical protein
MFYVLSAIAIKAKKYSLFMKLSGSLHASKWSSSEFFTNKLIANFVINDTSAEFQRFLKTEMQSYPEIESKKKFFDDPARLFKKKIIVLKPYNHNDKGLIVVKYSYYFLLLLKLFDIDKLLKRYHVVLEPSWAGYLNTDILAYLTSKHSIFVMCYEKKDTRLLRTLSSNLKPVHVGPNWWVPLVNFDKTTINKKFDIVIVASWSKFKRHYFIFKGPSLLKKYYPDMKIALVGYDGDLSKDFILDMAVYFDVRNNIELFEKIPSDEVFQVVSQSEVSILWSRFEGNNRSIIESMFRGTPVIFREGHNFGDDYDYINAQTAVVANEENFGTILAHMFEHYSDYAPSDYVENKHNYRVATQIIEQEIKKEDIAYMIGNAVYKVNYLWGMGYFNKQDENMFIEDYTYLSSCILSNVSVLK